MFEELSGYLVQAPIAVLMFIYIWLSDKYKSKMMDNYRDVVNKDKETTDKLIDLVEELTRKK